VNIGSVTRLGNRNKNKKNKKQFGFGMKKDFFKKKLVISASSDL